MEQPAILAEDIEGKAAAVPLTFEDLFVDQHERLYRALYLIVGNTHEAEELMQDAFLHVLAQESTDTPEPMRFRVNPNDCAGVRYRLRSHLRADFCLSRPD